MLVSTSCGQIVQRKAYLDVELLLHVGEEAAHDLGSVIDSQNNVLDASANESFDVVQDHGL